MIIMKYQVLSLFLLMNFELQKSGVLDGVTINLSDLKRSLMREHV